MFIYETQPGDSVCLPTIIAFIITAIIRERLGYVGCQFNSDL